MWESTLVYNTSISHWKPNLDLVIKGKVLQLLKIGDQYHAGCLICGKDWWQVVK